MGRLQDKVAIVTGASSGIGVEIAKCFAQEGAKVVLAARRIDEGNRITEEILSQGGEAIFVQTDVAKATDVENLVNRTINHFGRLDIAINNAGVTTPPVPLTEVTEDEYDRVLNINLKGNWLCLKYQIPHMLDNGGSIVNIASMWGVGASTFPVAIYTASKHGVVGLTKAAAMEYAKHKIRVNSICTAWIDKPGSLTSEDPEFKEQVIKSHPIGHLGSTNEVAQSAIYLCSDAARSITGQQLLIDAGISVNMPILPD